MKFGRCLENRTPSAARSDPAGPGRNLISWLGTALGWSETTHTALIQGLAGPGPSHAGYPNRAECRALQGWCSSAFALHSHWPAGLAGYLLVEDVEYSNVRCRFRHSGRAQVANDPRTSLNL